MIETNWSELCSTCSSSMSAQYRSFKTSHCSTGIKVIKVSLMVYSSQFQSYLLGLRSVPAHSVLATGYRGVDHGPVMQATHLYKTIYPGNHMYSKHCFQPCRHLNNYCKLHSYPLT